MKPRKEQIYEAAIKASPSNANVKTFMAGAGWADANREVVPIDSAKIKEMALQIFIKRFPHFNNDKYFEGPEHSDTQAMLIEMGEWAINRAVPIDWEKVWNECALREYAEYISHSNREFIQKLVEKQLSGTSSSKEFELIQQLVDEQLKGEK